jgi:hypothetical protein
MFIEQGAPMSLQSRVLRCARVATSLAAGVVLTLALAAPAHADVDAGDQYVYNWTEIGPVPGLSGTADLTLGAPISAGIFRISSFSVFQNGGFCGVCNSPTEDLSLVSFYAATLGVVGTVTGSFTGQHGGTHTFDLTTHDIVGGTGTWVFDDFNVTSDSTTRSNGTYATTVLSVDEPSVLFLLAPGLGAVAWLAWRRKLRLRELGSAW